ncbi:MAG: DUF4290 domain-containing protein [Chitinophagales bacterium]
MQWHTTPKTLLNFEANNLKQMKYNTTRNQLVFKEYGRNVQRMIEHITTMEDSEKKKELALAIIDLLGQMNPHLKNVDDFKHKLWDHLYMMSDYKLDVDDAPYPAPPRLEDQPKPKHPGYPKHKIKLRHYGKNVESLIEKAKEFDDEEKKKAFAEVIGNYMKLVYQNWNKENVNDQIIMEDIQKLSGNKLELTEDSNLDTLAKSNRSKRKPYSGKKRSNNPRSNNKRNRRK